MHSRVLPPEEWHRLGEEIPGMQTFPGLRPEDQTVVVVESDGKIAACLTVLRIVHFEGLWIDPEHKNAGVARSLLREAESAALNWTDYWVYGGAADDRMRGLLTRIGGRKVPIDTYVVSIGGGVCPTPSQSL